MLIEYVMDFLKTMNISQKTIVSGFKSDQIASYLSINYPDTIVVKNNNFTTGNIMSLHTALPYIRKDEGFLLMNTDHIYRKPISDIIMKAENNIAAICDFDRVLGDDDMKIKLNAKGKLQKIDKKLIDFDGGYIGMTFCPSNHIEDYRKSLEDVLNEKGHGACVENVLGNLASSNIPIDILDASNIGWFEVDTKSDRDTAEKSLSEKKELLS